MSDLESKLIEKIVEDGLRETSIRGRLRYGMRLYRKGFAAKNVCDLLGIDPKKLRTEINVQTASFGKIGRRAF